MSFIPTKIICIIVLSLLSVSCHEPMENRQGLLADTFADQGAAISAGNLQAFTSYYAETPIHLPPGAPMNSTRKAIQEHLGGKLGLYQIEDAPTIRFSDDSSMAFVFGIYTIQADESRGIEDTRGRFVTIWRIGENGKWECVVDIWNSGDPRFAHL
jgi:ketosteroid isomerase-like protein